MVISLMTRVEEAVREVADDQEVVGGKIIRMKARTSFSVGDGRGVILPNGAEAEVPVLVTRESTLYYTDPVLTIQSGNGERTMIQAKAVEASGRGRRMSEGKMCMRCAVYTMQFMVVLFLSFLLFALPAFV